MTKTTKTTNNKNNNKYYVSPIKIKLNKETLKKVFFSSSCCGLSVNKYVENVLNAAFTDPSKRVLNRIKLPSTHGVAVQMQVSNRSREPHKMLSERSNSFQTSQILYLPSNPFILQAVTDYAYALGRSRPQLIAEILNIEVSSIKELPKSFVYTKKVIIKNAKYYTLPLTPEEVAAFSFKATMRTKQIAQKIKKNVMSITDKNIDSVKLKRGAIQSRFMVNIESKDINKLIDQKCKELNCKNTQLLRACVLA